MANKRITELPVASTLDGNELVELVQGGTNVKCTLSTLVGLATGVNHFRGPYDASGGGYPATGGNGPAGVPGLGDEWWVSVSGIVPGPSGDIFVEANHTILKALVTTPGQTPTNWAIITW